LARKRGRKIFSVKLVTKAKKVHGKCKSEWKNEGGLEMGMKSHPCPRDKC